MSEDWHHVRNHGPWNSFSSFDFLSATTMSAEPPRKFVLTPEQLSAFQESGTCKEIISYIETLNDSVVGVTLRRECSESEVRLPVGP